MGVFVKVDGLCSYYSATILTTCCCSSSAVFSEYCRSFKEPMEQLYLPFNLLTISKYSTVLKYISIWYQKHSLVSIAAQCTLFHFLSFIRVFRFMKLKLTGSFFFMASIANIKSVRIQISFQFVLTLSLGLSLFLAILDPTLRYPRYNSSHLSIS